MKKDKFVNKDPSKRFGEAYRKTLNRPIESGNIDLKNRPVVNNPNGSISTLDSISIGEDGKEVLIPTIVKGRKVSDDEAVNHYRRTGEHLGKYDSIDTANTYANALHDIHARRYARSNDPNVIKEIQMNAVPKSEIGKTELDPTQGYGTYLNKELWYNRLPDNGGKKKYRSNDTVVRKK